MTVKMFISGLLACGLLSGCGLQAEIIQARHWDLNETIRDTAEEQLLLNLVRLRYDEEPYFLQLAGITTNFTASASAGASGTIPEGGNNVLGLDAGISYSESPTVTWSIPDSREFLGQRGPQGCLPGQADQASRKELRHFRCLVQGAWLGFCKCGEVRRWRDGYRILFS